MDTAWETNFTVILFKEILCTLKKLLKKKSTPT